VQRSWNTRELPITSALLLVTNMLPDGVTAMEDDRIMNDVVLSDVRVSPALTKDLVPVLGTGDKT
jgi:hypothetical protein